MLSPVWKSSVIFMETKSVQTSQLKAAEHRLMLTFFLLKSHFWYVKAERSVFIFQGNKCSTTREITEELSVLKGQLGLCFSTVAEGEEKMNSWLVWLGFPGFLLLHCHPLPTCNIFHTNLTALKCPHQPYFTILPSEKSPSLLWNVKEVRCSTRGNSAISKFNT